MNTEVGQTGQFHVMAKGQKSLVNFPKLDHSIESIQSKNIGLHKQRWQVTDYSAVLKDTAPHMKRRTHAANYAPLCCDRWSNCY